jgi:hypothetical protein
MAAFVHRLDRPYLHLPNPLLRFFLRRKKGRRRERGEALGLRLRAIGDLRRI